MLMVADLSGVGWRFFDGEGWRRRHPCISFGFFSSSYGLRPKAYKTSRVVSSCSCITVLTKFYNQLITLFIDIWQNHHGGELRSMYYMLQMVT